MQLQAQCNVKRIAVSVVGVIYKLANEQNLVCRILKFQPIPPHLISYQTPRPLPCCCKCRRATRFRKCCFKVFRLASVSFTASAIVTRPCSRANSTICSDSLGSVASTIFSRLTFFSSLRTCSASDRKCQVKGTTPKRTPDYTHSFRSVRAGSSDGTATAELPRQQEPTQNSDLSPFSWLKVQRRAKIKIVTAVRRFGIPIDGASK